MESKALFNLSKYLISETNWVEKMVTSVGDLQNRMQEILYQFSGREPETQSEKTLKNALTVMANRALDPKVDKVKLEEDLVSNLMNILILSAELGIDIESKIEEVLCNIENKLKGFSAS